MSIKNLTDIKRLTGVLGKTNRRPMTFFCVGIIVSLFAFVVTYLDTDHLLQQEYGYKSIRLNGELQGAMDDLKRSIRDTGAVVKSSWQLSQDEGFLKETVIRSNKNLAQFDHVLWMYETPSGQIESINLHINPTFGAQNAATISQQLDEIKWFLKERNVMGIGRTRVDLDLPVFDDLMAVRAGDDRSSFFAVMQPLEKENMRAGLILGIANVQNVVTSENVIRRYNIARLKFYDNASGRDLYMYVDDQSLTSQSDQYDMERRIDMMETPWLTTVRFAKTDHVAFTQSIPWGVLALGIFVSLLGTYLLRNSSGHEEELGHVNAELEKKNFELEDQINEKQKLNAVLQESEEENQAIIDSVSEVIAEIDYDGRIMTLNMAWERITGFSQEQFLGIELFAALHPQDQDRQRKEFRMMIEGQRDRVRSMANIRSADGTFRSVEVSLSFVRGVAHRNRRVVATIMDIEERRRAEKALHEAEKKYRTIVENAAGGIFQLTPEGLYLSANPALARLLGYNSPEDVLRQVRNANMDVYLDPHARMSFNRELDVKRIEHGHEVQVRKKDGTLIWVNENIRVVEDEAGHVLYYEGSLEDITVRKEANIALRKAKMESDLANRAKSEFLANMSHELRTPLNSIIGFSEVIKDEIFGKIEQRQYWEYSNDIHASGRKLLDIINEILDISKIDAGERQLNESVVNLKKITMSCRELMAEKIQSGDIAMQIDLDDAPAVVAEELAVKQITMNLMSNAVKFTQQGGSVHISAKVNEAGELVYAFTDTGIGLLSDEIEKAMSAFGQLDNALNRSGSGTGLGLTLVRSLIELHGGEVEMMSEKGIGTTVNVIFPARRVSSSDGEKTDNVVPLKG